MITFLEITPGLIRQYLIGLELSRNAGGIHASYRALRALFIWHLEEFEPDDWKNPIRKVKPPKVAKNPLPGVPIVDVLAMVKACKGENGLRDRAILLTLLDTGVRAGELLEITMKDLNLMSGEILIPHGKGNKARTVFLGSLSRKAVKAYLKTRGALYEDDPLFISRLGGRLTYGGLVHMAHSRAAKAKVPAPGLHDLRRCFAVTMLRSGVDLVSLARLMGHSNLEILRRYLNLNTDDIRAAHAQGSPVDKADC